VTDILHSMALADVIRAALALGDRVLTEDLADVGAPSADAPPTSPRDRLGATREALVREAARLLCLAAAADAGLSAEVPGIAEDMNIRMQAARGLVRAKVTDVIRAVAMEMGIPAPDIVGHCRVPRLARARFAVAWVASRSLGHSASTIGRALGDRDHSTILYALRRADELRVADPAFLSVTDRLAGKTQGKPSCQQH
jgi:hypothetical protein